VALNNPGWDDPASRVLACTLAGFEDAPDLHIMMNMHWEAHDFDVPAVKGYRWYRIIDTAQPSPDDIVEEATAPPVDGGRCRVEGRSIVVLFTK
jgi:glycogen operon protein